MPNEFIERIAALELLLATLIDAYVPNDEKLYYSANLITTLCSSITVEQISLEYLLNRLATLDSESGVGMQRVEEVLLELKDLKLQELASRVEPILEELDAVEEEVQLHQIINSKFSELFLANMPLLYELGQRSKQTETDKIRATDYEIPISGSEQSKTGYSTITRTNDTICGLRCDPTRSMSKLEKLQQSDTLAKHKIVLLEEKIKMEDDLIRKERIELQNLRHYCFK